MDEETHRGTGPVSTQGSTVVNTRPSPVGYQGRGVRRVTSLSVTFLSTGVGLTIRDRSTIYCASWDDGTWFYSSPRPSVRTRPSKPVIPVIKGRQYSQSQVVLFLLCECNPLDSTRNFFLATLSPPHIPLAFTLPHEITPPPRLCVDPNSPVPSFTTVLGSLSVLMRSQRAVLSGIVGTTTSHPRPPKLWGLSRRRRRGKKTTPRGYYLVLVLGLPLPRTTMVTLSSRRGPFPSPLPTPHPDLPGYFLWTVWGIHVIVGFKYFLKVCESGVLLALPPFRH